MASSYRVLVNFPHATRGRVMTADKPPVRGAPLYATENVQGTWVIKDVQNREGEDTAPEYQFAVRVGPAH